MQAAVRQQAGKVVETTAAILDSQAVRTAGKRGGCWGYDAGKGITGRKRQLLVDTLGLVLVAHVQLASEQGRRGARPVFAEAARCYSALRRVWADGGYSGPLVVSAAPTRFQVVIVAKPAGSKTFTALPRRWVVERTFA